MTGTSSSSLVLLLSKFVHRGQLERHSEIFSDLFSVPQPMEQDLIDGCSYVELPDCPSDVFHFLSAPYDGLYEFYSEKGQVVSDRLMFHLTDTFKTLSRLASLLLYVYQPNILLSIFDNVISRVDTDWPSTLCGWDFRERRSKDEYGQYVPREICLHPISVIELALDMNLLSSLLHYTIHPVTVLVR